MTNHKTAVACYLGIIDGSPYGQYECYPPFEGQSLAITTRAELECAGYVVQMPDDGEEYLPSTEPRVIRRLS